MALAHWVGATVAITLEVASVAIALKVTSVAIALEVTAVAIALEVASVAIALEVAAWSVMTSTVITLAALVGGLVACPELGVLDCAALATQVVEAAIEYHILSQLALNVAIEQGVVERCLEAQVVDEFLVGAHDEPAVIAQEHLLELGAKGGIELGQLVAGEALAIRGVGDEHAFLGSRFLLLERLALNLNVLCEAGILHVGIGGSHCLAQNVVAVNLVLELALPAVVVIDFLKEVSVVVGPLLEGIFLAIHAWIDVGGYERCLNQECA